MKCLITILTFFFIADCVAQNEGKMRIRGFVDTYHAVRVKQPNDFLSSRTRFRGELEMINERSYFFTSVNAIHNKVLPDLSAIQFREAYLEYTGEKWGFKAGKQIVIWGKADGLRITDVISPMDLSEFLAQDFDDIRIPVNALIVSRFGKNWDLDLICVPVFTGFILPGNDNPWALDNASENNNIVYEEAETPETSLSNLEFGGKLSFYFNGIDFEFYALRTWNKSPIYTWYYDDSISAIHMKPHYHRLGFLGFSFSKSVQSLVIRGESAYYFNKKFSAEIENAAADLLTSNSIHYLIGIDWYPGNEWTVTGQFSDEQITNYADKIQRQKHDYITTLGITRKIFRSTLSLSSFAYIGLNEGGAFTRLSGDYSLSDNIHLMTGFDWFNGDNGLFGQYKDNSQIWIKAKYNF